VLAVETELLRGGGGLEGDAAVLQGKVAAYQLAAVELLEQALQQLGLGVELEDQFQRAAEDAA
jgi:hypothetical protein